MQALLFDCDGVLADTERYGHLPAFNRTFAELGVPLHWSDEEYAQRLLIGGGKERVNSALTPELAAEAGIPTDAEGRRDWLATFHARKTENFAELVESGALPARPGLVDLVDAAIEKGLKLAVVSTTAERSARAVLESTIGPERAAHFAYFVGDMVPAKKPDPGIYLLALAELGVDASEAVAVEDSRNGLLAAVGAGIACIVTPSAYTHDERFDEAALVVAGLDDPAASLDRLAALTT